MIVILLVIFLYFHDLVVIIPKLLLLKPTRELGGALHDGDAIIPDPHKLLALLVEDLEDVV